MSNSLLLLSAIRGRLRGNIEVFFSPDGVEVEDKLDHVKLAKHVMSRNGGSTCADIQPTYSPSQSSETKPKVPNTKLLVCPGEYVAKYRYAYNYIHNQGTEIARSRLSDVKSMNLCFS